MTTIKDVAAATGLSVTTVSVVLSGKADGRGIAHGTRKRVFEAAARMGFRHNGHARALRTGRSNLIGVVGVSLDKPIPLLGLRHAAQALLQHSYEIALHDLAWHHGDADRALRDLDSRRVEGLLIVTSSVMGARDALRVMADRGLPIVTLDDWGFPGADVVTVDREQGAYAATRHLIALGHKRIALTVPPDTGSGLLRARLLGYRRAHEEAGLPVDERLFMAPDHDYPGFEDGLALVPRVLNHPARPSALFCTNDRLAIGALRALYEAGRRVPEELALVGFDGIEESEFTVVPLTTVAQPMAEVAEQAVVLLVDRLGGTAPHAEPRRIVVSPRLIVRNSCGAGTPAG